MDVGQTVKLRFSHTTGEIQIFQLSFFKTFFRLRPTPRRKNHLINNLTYNAAPLKLFSYDMKSKFHIVAYCIHSNYNQKRLAHCCIYSLWFSLIHLAAIVAASLLGECLHQLDTDIFSQGFSSLFFSVDFNWTILIWKPLHHTVTLAVYLRLIVLLQLMPGCPIGSSSL